MVCDTKIGIDFIDTKFSLHAFHVKDLISESQLYPYLLYTHQPMATSAIKGILMQKTKLLEETSYKENVLDSNNCLNLRFQKNPSFPSNCPFKLYLHSDASMLIFANLYCVGEILNLFSDAGF